MGSNNQFNWSLVGNTKGFGHGINDGRPFYAGDFNGDGRSDVLFYFPGDDNWWLGTYGTNNQLNWTFAGNTKGFGHGINDGRAFYIGDFNGDKKSNVMFFFPGDLNWWLGSHNGQILSWSLVGNTGRPYKSNVRVHTKVLTTPTIAIDTMVQSMRSICYCKYSC